MKILYVLAGHPSGVSHIFTKRQAFALTQAGVQIEFCFIKLWTCISMLISDYSKLRRVIDQIRPDILHAQYGTMTAAISALTNPPKFVVTFRGSDLAPVTGSIGRRVLGVLLSQLAALKAQSIICVSDHLRERLWWKRDCAVVIPSGVDMGLFLPMSKSEARRQLDLDFSERIVLFNVGNDPVRKGLELAEAAVMVAKNLVGPIRLIILSNNIDPNNMPIYYNAADCLLVASKQEGSPNVVKEAMACNVPIVSTRVADVEVRLQNVYPSIIADRDPIELGTGLSNILRAGLRSNGREMVTDVSLEVTTKRIMQVYSEVCSS